MNHSELRPSALEIVKLDRAVIPFDYQLRDRSEAGGFMIIS
jgi:hypothetical protein